MSPERDDTTDVTPTVTIAKIYEEQGHLHKAADVYKKLIALEPDRIELKEALRGIERRLEDQIAVPRESEAKNVLHRLERLQETVRRRKGVIENGRARQRKILVIHGPKEDAAGMAQPSTPGDVTLEEIDLEVKKTAETCAMSVETFQSDDEQELVRKIRGASQGYDVLIINPAEYAFTSVAIRDALLTLEFPVIEVHLSNIHGQEPSHHKCLVAEAVTAYIAGFGKEGYTMAVRAAAVMSS